MGRGIKRLDHDPTLSIRCSAKRHCRGSQSAEDFSVSYQSLRHTDPYAQVRWHPGSTKPSMTQPVTERDARFSDTAAVAADWDQTRRTLEAAELFWIATVRADGRPHATPLVGVWLDDAIYFATGFGEQKAVNLRTNQNVILMTGCNEWERGLGRRGRGRGRPSDRRERPQTAHKGVGDEWDGRWHYEVHEGGFRHDANADAILVFSVQPAKVLAFAKGPSARSKNCLALHRVRIRKRRERLAYTNESRRHLEASSYVRRHQEPEHPRGLTLLTRERLHQERRRGARAPAERCTRRFRGRGQAQAGIR
jgi:Pyridoxamine 5'-phosphate oxidase